MPISRLVVVASLVLAACHRQAAAPAGPPGEQAATIPCATGTAPLAPRCTVAIDAGVITVRNPNGGFHRLRITPGQGVTAADGAEPARVTPAGADGIDVAIGGDRYRLPATVKRQ